MDVPELEPLDELEARNKPYRRQFSRTVRTWHRVPLRVLRLLILLVLLPTLFLCIPVYLRYRVYSGQMYPMGMTDMRLIDSKISTTWCQRQVVQSNVSFNAFVVPSDPELADKLVQVSMTRQLDLSDDMKEYWGFYFLQGSTVTVSACVRWPGASLIMIKGYKHLQECAYIGDDSSEELDELLEANKLGLLNDTMLVEKLLQLKKEDGPANDPETMRRHKSGVSFHHPSQVVNETAQDTDPIADITDHDPKELKDILEKLHAIRQAAKIEAQKRYHPPAHLVSLPALHRHRDTNVDRDEQRWLSFKDLDYNKLSHPNATIEDEVLNNNESGIITDETEESIAESNEETLKRDNVSNKSEEVLFKSDIIGNGTNSKETENVTEVKYTEKVTIANDHESKGVFDEKRNEEYKDLIAKENVSQSSHEVYKEVIKKLQTLGDRGQRVLKRLHDTVNLEEKVAVPRKSEATVNSEEQLKQLEHLSQILIEAIDEERQRPELAHKRHEARMTANKVKRELYLGSTSDKFVREMNEDDEDRDFAAEEGVEPDGYAEHHNKVNETTPFDMSNSEFWSSFSSSEEALLECTGLILNLPLTPHRHCSKEYPQEKRLRAAQRNAITYRVPANGYYFFIFNSENEVQDNFINVRFDMQKTMYDVARTALRMCKNSTERCDLPLDLFSNQKVVLEMPLKENDSLWNEQFLVMSECEPRTSVYLACVIAVPLLIMIFAFQ